MLTVVKSLLPTCQVFRAGAASLRPLLWRLQVPRILFGFIILAYKVSHDFSLYACLRSARKEIRVI